MARRRVIQESTEVVNILRWRDLFAPFQERDVAVKFRDVQYSDLPGEVFRQYQHPDGRWVSCFCVSGGRCCI